jgi:hypothetical protein
VAVQLYIQLIRCEHPESLSVHTTAASLKNASNPTHSPLQTTLMASPIAKQPIECIDAIVFEVDKAKATNGSSPAVLNLQSALLPRVISPPSFRLPDKGLTLSDDLGSTCEGRVACAKRTGFADPD